MHCFYNVLSYSLLCTSREIQQHLLNGQMNQLVCIKSWQDNFKVILKEPLSDVSLAFPKCDKNHSRRSGKKMRQWDKWDIDRWQEFILVKNVSCWNYKWRTHYRGQECKCPWGYLECCMKGSGERQPGKEGWSGWRMCQANNSQQRRLQGSPGGGCYFFFFAKSQ